MTSKMFLFHQDEPEGRMFKVDFVAEHEETLRADGWVDTPALLDLPPKEPEITKEQAENMAPDALVGMVKSLGFMVMTPEEFEGKVMQKVAEKQEFADEVDGRSIGEIFDEDAPSLTKDQLVEFGNETYDLGLKKTMSEATMIEKIKAVRG